MHISNVSHPLQAEPVELGRGYMPPPHTHTSQISQILALSEATPFSSKDILFHGGPPPRFPSSLSSVKYTIRVDLYSSQRYKYGVLQTIQMKLILLCAWAERAVLDSAKTALRFKYEI